MCVCVYERVFRNNDNDNNDNRNAKGRGGERRRVRRMRGKEERRLDNPVTGMSRGNGHGQGGKGLCACARVCVHVCIHVYVWEAVPCCGVMGEAAFCFPPPRCGAYLYVSLECI